MEQQQDQLQSEIAHPIADAKSLPNQPLNLAAGAGTFLTMGVVDVIGNFGPTGLVVGAIGAVIAARHGDEIYQDIRNAVVPMLPAPRPAPEHIPDGAPRRSFMDRMLGRFPEYVEESEDGDTQQPETQPEEWDEGWYDRDDEPSPLPSTHHANFTFSEVLGEGFKPSLRKIFLGRLTDGTNVYVEAKDLCHVALAGNTGGGKSSLMRMIMAQLCKAGIRVLLLNPHYMSYDRKANEDWTPFDSYLEKPPIDCAQYAAIETYLQWMAKTLLPKRIERAREGKPIGKPFFVVIDELPAIVAEVKEAPAYIAKLLREGRKYGIYLVVAAQDFLAKTVAADGEGAIRKMYRTALYVGGDGTTAKMLLNIPANQIPENELGKGTVMLRCSATKQAVLAKVPYVDNESLYTLLGPSTFVPSNRDDDDISTSSEDDTLTSESNIQQDMQSGREVGNEVARSGQEVAEVAEVAKVVLSEHKLHIATMFFDKGLGINVIMKELYPGVTGGEKYKQANAEITDALRKYVQSQKA